MDIVSRLSEKWRGFDIVCSQLKIEALAESRYDDDFDDVIFSGNRKRSEPIDIVFRLSEKWRGLGRVVSSFPDCDRACSIT